MEITINELTLWLVCNRQVFGIYVVDFMFHVHATQKTRATREEVLWRRAAL